MRYHGQTFYKSVMESALLVGRSEGAIMMMIYRWRTEILVASAIECTLRKQEKGFAFSHSSKDFQSNKSLFLSIKTFY